MTDSIILLKSAFNGGDTTNPIFNQRKQVIKSNLQQHTLSSLLTRTYFICIR